MNREFEIEAELERTRIESFALSANQATNPEFLKHLLSLRNEDSAQIQEEIEPEWVTPDPESIESFLRGF